MSDSLAASGIVEKPVDIGARGGNATGKRISPRRLSLVAVVIPAVFLCSAAMAQVSGMASPTPTIGATSPFGMGMDSAVSPTGIPLGSTEIASPGVSPAPAGVTGTISMPSSGATCSTIGAAPSEMYGSTATYDGGGMTMGTATPATGANLGTMATSGTSTSSGMLDTAGLSGMCGSGSSSVASSSAPTSTTPTTAGGAARTGIPLGSTEIGNLGVSSAAAVPMLSVSPTVATMGPVPTMPTTSSAIANTIGITPNILPGSDPSGSTLAPTGAGSQ
jgi:hypothetical protein